MQARVLEALETAGVFTSGGLVKDKVLSIKLSHTIYVFHNVKTYSIVT